MDSSKRVRFGLTYKGAVRFFKEVLNGVDLRSIECVSVDDLHYVLITTNKPCAMSCISDAMKQHNEKAEQKMEVVPFDGAEIVTFSKAQGYMQHPFYAPFQAAKKEEEAGGKSSHWCWNVDDVTSVTGKRASKELESDLVQSVITPSMEKRARVAPTREVSRVLPGFACVCADVGGPLQHVPGRRMTFKRAQRKQSVVPAVSGMIPVDLVYELAKCKDETIKAKNYTIQLLESMLPKPKAVVEGA